jgi:hypothetical protein
MSNRQSSEFFWTFKVFERDVDLDMTPIQGYVLQMLIFFKAYISITYVTFLYLFQTEIFFKKFI